MAVAMFAEVAAGIRQVVQEQEMFLGSLGEEMISSRFNDQNRSVKQILGHMIDSASNNLHRIVHLQYGENLLVFPNYATNGNNDHWIAIQDYQNEDWHTLVQLWKYGNLHIAHVIENINPDRLDNKWIAGPGAQVSLRDMVTDYPRHMDLHIGEIHELCSR